MAAGETSGSDFFLQFGSDAAPFSESLATDLGKGVEAVEALKAALEQYEEVAGRVRGGGSVSINFDGLTAAADRIETATTQFTKQFGTQLGALTKQVAGLSETLASAARGLPARTDSPRREPRRAESSAAPTTTPAAQTAGAQQRAEDGPRLREYPVAPKPPKDPYGRSQPNGLEGWPTAPRNSQDPKQQAAYRKAVDDFVAKNPKVADVARKYDAAMTAFGNEVASFTTRMNDHRKQVAEIDKANAAAIAKWEAATGQKYGASAAPAEAVQPRPIKPVPPEPQRPAAPVKPETLGGLMEPPTSKSTDSYVARWEKAISLLQQADPAAAEAAEAYEQAVAEFEKADRVFQEKYKAWQKAAEVIKRANAEAEAFNAKIPTPVAAPAAPPAPAPSAAPTVNPAAATAVTEQDLAAVRARKKEEAAQEAKAVAQLTAFNAGLSTSAKAVEEALSGLVDKITAAAGGIHPSELAEGADSRAGGVHQVEVVNGEAEPVPVIVVGGEEGAHQGKTAKGGEPKTPHKATTATSDERVEEEVGAKEAGGSKSEPATSTHETKSASVVDDAGEKAAIAAAAPVGAALTETVRSIEQWEALSEARRSRLERNGITQESYLAGAPIGAAGGKNPVPGAERAYNDAVGRAASQYENLDEFNPYEHDEVVDAERRLQAARAEQAAVEAARARRNAPPASERVPTPAPTPPPAPATNGRDPFARLGEGKRDLTRDADRAAQFGSLQPATQRTLAEARDRLIQLSQQEMTEEVRTSMERTVGQAAHAFKSDPTAGMRYFDPATGKQVDNRPHINEQFGNPTGSMAAFLDFMGMHAPGAASFVRGRVFPAGQLADSFNTRSGPASSPAGSAGNSSRVQKMDDEALEENSARLARYNEILATTHGEVTSAALAHAKAEFDLAQVMMAETRDADAYAAAMQRVIATERNLQTARDRQATQEDTPAQQTGYQRFKGTNSTFGQDLRRHLANTGLNQVGYTLAFVGFDKLKELVDTGIQAQAVYVRLQASLDANGIAAGNLQTHLAQISATTATPLDHVYEAAAELSGTFKNVGDIEFGTNIAAQLANISQGALSAQQAAVGLRDVFASFGDDWAKTGMTVQQGLQQTGDQIASLSQKTGVSVKDITEGTTQIAAEAHEFGLNQGQAATLAAYIAKGTGQSGEQSAAQASRMFATLYNGKTQSVLEGTRIYDPKTGKVETNRDGSPKTLATSQQFAAGDLGGILGNIAGSWGDLSPRQRQQITAQMGTGIQARAFDALVGGGKSVQRELNGTADDSGTLGKQNQAFLRTVEGEIKQMDEDFQNLGNTLQRIGALDAVGLLAKGLDELFKTINKYVGGFASLMNSNPLTSGILHTSTILLEAAAAWKLFGGSLANSSLLRRRVAGLTPANQREIEAAQAQGLTPPRPRYGYTDVWRRTRLDPRAGVSRTRSWANDVFRQGNYADLTPRGIAARGAVQGAGAQLEAAQRRLARAEMEATAATEKESAAQVAATEAHEALTRAEQEGTAVETELTAMRSAQLKSAAALSTAQKQAAAATEAQAAAAAAATKSEEDVAAANARLAGVRSQGVGGSLGSSLTGGRLLGALPLLAFLGGSTVGHAVGGGQSASSGARGMTGATVGDATTFAGLGGMIAGPYGAAAGAVIGAGKGLLDGVLGAKHREEALPSGKSDQDYLDLMNLVYNNPNSGRAVKGAKGRLGYGNATTKGIDDLNKIGTVDGVNQWAAAETAFIQKHAKDIEKAGGNNKTAQKAIAGQINTLIKNLQNTAAGRIAALEGLSKIDQLNSTQLASLTSVAGTIGGLDSNTLKTQGSAVLTLLQNSGLPTSSRAYQSLLAATGQGNVNTLGVNDKGALGKYDASGRWNPANEGDTVGMSTTEAGRLPHLGTGPYDQNMRLKALQNSYQAAIKSANAKLNSPGLSDADRTAYQSALSTAMTGYQQTTQQMYQAPIQQQQGRASYYAAQGGTSAGSDNLAVGALSKANADLKNYNKHLEVTDPQYWANLQSIQQNKLQIAQLQNQPALNALGLAAAQATDASAQASLKYQQAVKQLGIDQAGGANSKTIGDDRIAIASAGIGQRQASANVAEATAQANMAGIQNGVQKARAQYNDAIRLQRLYGSGGSLQDQASYQQAVAQAKQARIAIAEAVQADAQATYDVAAAIATMKGDAVGAALDNYRKALQAYHYDVAAYGKNSAQARDAYAQVIQQSQALWQAQLDQQNSALDLQIAQLQARGQAGDATRAAQDQVQKVKNAINSYLKHGGKKGTKQYNDLQGQLATAQRNAFDVSLQAQMDTLDFQQQTYKITSAQEVQALQQILKNKQLTLQEQRDITLKIKNLQDSIREQLTQGGLNIPSGITLPTAYDVRRSLGAGFSGGTGTVTTNNNNQQVQINNNVASSAQVAEITRQVVTAVSATLGRQVRASTSTPRTVATK